MPSKKQQTNWLIYLAGLVVIIVILVIVFGRGGVQIPKPVPTPTPDVQVLKLSQQSTSDDLTAIEQDLQNTNLEQIDQELTEVDQSLQSL